MASTSGCLLLLLPNIPQGFLEQQNLRRHCLSGCGYTYIHTHTHTGAKDEHTQQPPPTITSHSKDALLPVFHTLYTNLSILGDAPCLIMHHHIGTPTVEVIKRSLER